jgi:hypothetical protein
MQTPSLSFEINNCFLIVSKLCRKIPGTFEAASFKQRYSFFADSLNIAGIVVLYENIMIES